MPEQVILIRCIARAIAALLLLCSAVASAKVTGGAVMVEGLEVREAPSPDSAIVMRLERGRHVLLSKAPAAPPGWMHLMLEDESAEMRHGYVPLGTVGVLMLRTSSGVFATAQGAAAFPAVRVQAELNTIKCKRVPRSLGRLESCVVSYVAHLVGPEDFRGSALTSCTSALDFQTADGARTTASEQERLEVISTLPDGVEGSVEIAVPPGGSYDQAGFGGIRCQLEKVATF